MWDPLVLRGIYQSLCSLTTGSNDILACSQSYDLRKTASQEYVAQTATTLKAQLKVHDITH